MCATSSSAAASRSKTIGADLQEARARFESARRALCPTPEGRDEAGRQLLIAEQRFRRGRPLAEVLAAYDRFVEHMDCDKPTPRLASKPTPRLAPKPNPRPSPAAASRPATTTPSRPSPRHASPSRPSPRHASSSPKAPLRPTPPSAVSPGDPFKAARALRDAAIRRGAERQARITLADADSLLAAADRRAWVLGDAAGGRQLALAAAEEYQHAGRLAHDIGVMLSDQTWHPELLVRHYEVQFGRVAGALRIDPQYSRGIVPVTERILARIRSWDHERRTALAQLGETAAAARGLSTELALAQGGAAPTALDRLLEELRALVGEDGELVLRGDTLVVRARRLEFASGSAAVQPESKGLLKELARVVSGAVPEPVWILGHADAQGSSAQNLALSNRRADAVRSYVAATGPRLSLRARGVGEAAPIARNDSPSGRARNRRVEWWMALPADLPEPPHVAD